MADSYQAWISKQLRTGTGERHRRLREGLGHAEQLFAQTVWLPAVGHYEHLHAEYAVNDFRDGVRYIDLAYLRPPHKIAIELDGFGPHARDLDRRAFADGLMRQNHLVLDGWLVLRFAYDDIKQHPRTCQQILLQMLGRLYGSEPGDRTLSLQQREVLRLAELSGKPLKPADVASHLDVGIKSARKLLHGLLQSGHLVALGKAKRVHRFALGRHSNAQ